MGAAGADPASYPMSAPCTVSDRDPALERLPLYLTGDEPALGGTIKERPEDFLVEEQPLYQPSGEGEHVYLLVEKRELTTSEVVRLVARHFGVRPSAVGVAGQKDKHAITRQVVSIHTPGRTIDDVPMLEHERLRVLWADMHTNKLRLGHLSGNRFSVKIRGVDMTRVLVARRVLARLSEVGAPNFFGPQRFGVRRDGHILGRLLILGRDQELLDHLLGPDEAEPERNAEARARYARGDLSAARDAFPRACRAERVVLDTLIAGKPAPVAIKRIDPETRRLWISAFQSALFNRALAHRLELGTCNRLGLGDVAMKHANGAMFDVDEEAARDPTTSDRLSSLEISPTGPLWGAEMKRCGGDADEVERALLEASGVAIEDLAHARQRTGVALAGDRRPLRVPLRDPEVEGGIDEHGHYVRCAFELPKGAFATAALREVIKPALAGEDEATRD